MENRENVKNMENVENVENTKNMKKNREKAENVKNTENIQNSREQAKYCNKHVLWCMQWNFLASEDQIVCWRCYMLSEQAGQLHKFCSYSREL